MTVQHCLKIFGIYTRDNAKIFGIYTRDNAELFIDFWDIHSSLVIMQHCLKIFWTS